MVRYNPIKCNEHSHKIRTVRDALSLPSKTLVEFKREYGRQWAIDYVAIWLIELNDFLNLKTKMTDAQIEFTAAQIYDNYSLKVTDLTLFFKNVKAGVYGQFYESLGPEKILEWMDAYYEQRCEYAQMINEEKSNINTLKVHPDVAKEMFKGVGDSKVEFDHEKSTLGKRERQTALKALKAKIEQTSTKELKEYLADNDYGSDTYSELTAGLINAELDKRNR